MAHADSSERPPALESYAYGLVILAFLLLDFVPRFFQGDSITYLQTSFDGSLPPERSWSFGLVVNAILRCSHGYSAFILLQAAVFALLVGLMRRFFQDRASWRIAYALTAVVICLDPVMELYLRFFLSDFAAGASFLVFLLGAQVLIDPASSRRTLLSALLVMLAAAIVAIFFRVAYAAIIALTVLLIAAFCFARISAGRRIGLACAAGMPFLAVALLVFANSIVFAQRYPHEIFVSKLSGVFLAAAFSPALKMADFEHAGVPITSTEFQQLSFGEYDKRWTHIWILSHDKLRQLLADKLKVDVRSSPEIDRVATRLVVSALRRDPLSIAAVYVKSGAMYFSPRDWRERFRPEMGLNTPLPESFVTFFNGFSVVKITSDITRVLSPLLSIYQAIATVYPFQLLLGCAAAVLLLLRERRRPGIVVLSAALFADLLAAPLYSSQMVPRYILVAIFISYLLVGLAALSLLRGERPGALTYGST